MKKDLKKSMFSSYIEGLFVMGRFVTQPTEFPFTPVNMIEWTAFFFDCSIEREGSLT